MNRFRPIAGDKSPTSRPTGRPVDPWPRFDRLSTHGRPVGRLVDRLKIDSMAGDCRPTSRPTGRPVDPWIAVDPPADPWIAVDPPADHGRPIDPTNYPKSTHRPTDIPAKTFDHRKTKPQFWTVKAFDRSKLKSKVRMPKISGQPKIEIGPQKKNRGSLVRKILIIHKI